MPTNDLPPSAEPEYLGTAPAAEEGRRSGGRAPLIALASAAIVGVVAAAILANSADSLEALKRSIRLAAAGRRRDAGQDRRFDALIGGEELRRRLEALRRK